jgi:hypothetical protein
VHINLKFLYLASFRAKSMKKGLKVIKTKQTKVKIIKNERDPPFFTGKLLIKFQKILRNTTQVIIRHKVKILFSVISSKRGGSFSFLTIFTFAVPELLDLI